MSFLQGLLGPPDAEKMNKRKLWKLMVMLGLAVMGLLLLFFLLGRSAVGATPEGAGIIPDVDSCVCSGVWVTETVDSGGNVGNHTSLALEPISPYTPHISYHDVTSDSLKHAWLSGTTWLSETVDSGGDDSSLALVPTYPYTPCILYYNGDSPNFWEWFLRYACRGSTTWITMTLSVGMRAGQNGISLALEPTYPYAPHISYYNPWGTINTLYHAYLSGTVWCSGTWVHEQVEPSLSGVGWWSSLALEPTYPYTPHVSYYDILNGDLKYAYKSNTTWLTETVDSTGLPSFVRGGTSLELDQADAPHISYYDATNTNKDLKYAHFDSTVWITQTVDSEGDVGTWSSLALDQAGCPHISYCDWTNVDLKYAYIPAVCKIYFPIITKNH